MCKYIHPIKCSLLYYIYSFYICPLSRFGSVMKGSLDECCLRWFGCANERGRYVAMMLLLMFNEWWRKCGSGDVHLEKKAEYINCKEEDMVHHCGASWINPVRAPGQGKPKQLWDHVEEDASKSLTQSRILLTGWSCVEIALSFGGDGEEFHC